MAGNPFQCALAGRARPTRLNALALLVALGCGGNAVQAADIEHVIVISVDGLSGPLLGDLLRGETAKDLPAFRRLLAEGAGTLNARTDFTHTNTLPNHTTMLTGRPVLQPEGQPNTVHHGYTFNGSPSPTDTLHSLGNPNVSYVASAFDVAHDAGLSTALYASKSKFIIYEQSYNASAGAPDATGDDNGRDKIDTYVYRFTGDPPTAEELNAAFLADMAKRRYAFVFLHYADPDVAGHALGWGSPAWIDAVKRVDGYLAAVLGLVTKEPALAGRTTLIVTSDHGGTGRDHADPADPANYTIPFLAWGAGVTPGADLYELNAATRRDPGQGRPDYNAAAAPIRDGDAANMALSLLGRGPVPGSTINAAQDLKLRAQVVGVRTLTECLSGPAEASNPEICPPEKRLRADLQGDGDVDLFDVDRYLRWFQWEDGSPPTRAVAMPSPAVEQSPPPSPVAAPALPALRSE